MSSLSQKNAQLDEDEDNNVETPDFSYSELNAARLLSKLEERTANILRSINDIKKDLQVFRTDVVDNYVSKEAFSPVQKIVYGIVGGIVLAVIVAAIKLH